MGAIPGGGTAVIGEVILTAVRSNVAADHGEVPGTFRYAV